LKSQFDNFILSRLCGEDIDFDGLYLCPNEQINEVMLLRRFDIDKLRKGKRHGCIEEVVRHFFLLVQSFDLIDPILDLLHFIESKNYLIDLILDPEVIGLLFIELFLIFLQFGSLYVVIGSVIFIIFVQIEIDIMVGHDCHVFLP
jgi:hypothetical protein